MVKSLLIPEDAGRRTIVELHARNAERAGIRVALEDLSSPMLRDALAAWNAARGDRPYPTRAQMTPRNMKSFIRNVILIRVVEDDYEFRVMGEAQIESFGYNYAGMRVSQLDTVVDGMSVVLKRVYDKIVQTGKPYAFTGRLDRGMRHDLLHDTLYLPLGEDRVDHILNVTVYRPLY